MDILVKTKSVLSDAVEASTMTNCISSFSHLAKSKKMRSHSSILYHRFWKFKYVQ